MTSGPELIDVHASVGAHPRAYANGSTAEELSESLRRLGIRAAVVGSTTAVWHDPVHGNADALDAGRVAGLHPCVIAVPPTPEETDDTAALLADAVAAGAVAARIHPGTHDFDPLDPSMDAFYAKLVADQLPLTVELPEAGWPAIDRIADRWPELPVIVSALGYRALRQLAPVFRRHPNLHADTVNFATHEGWEWFVRQFGAERLLLGTGTPLRDPADVVARLQWSGLSAASRQLVGHDNALRLFGRLA
ncbi:amidohydrolase family protein [Flindersiella endophytica]